MQTSLEWYRSFVAVCRAGTVTAAARTLLMTQPGVSGHLVALEQAVGAPLFVRTTRRMVPTPEGEALYAQVVGAVERLERVEARLGPDGVDARPLVRLGAPREFFERVGVRAVAASVASGEARIDVTFGSTGALLGALREGRLDVVVATQRPRGRDVSARRLMTETFQLVSPPGLDIPAEFAYDAPASEALVDAWGAWLAGLPWVSYGAELPIVRRYWRGAFGVRPPFEASLVVPDLLGVCEAVALGAGVSLVPDYLCAASVAAGRVSVLPEIVALPTNELFVATRAEALRGAVEVLVERLEAAGRESEEAGVSVTGARASDGH